jgi:hypothetical protein
MIVLYISHWVPRDYAFFQNVRRWGCFYGWETCLNVSFAGSPSQRICCSWWHPGLLFVMYGTWSPKIWDLERLPLSLQRGNYFLLSCKQLSVGCLQGPLFPNFFLFYRDKCGVYFLIISLSSSISMHLCRVRGIISARAGLKKVPWDGYLKYSRPSPKHRERK